MGLFGIKSRKSFSSDTSSLSKHKVAAQPRQSNLEVSDVIGATPEFGSRRGPSHTSDTTPNLPRNSSSMKKFFGSTRRKGAQSIDAGSSAQPSKVLTSENFNNASSKRASYTSLNNKNNTKPVGVPATPPVITPSAITPSLSTPAAEGDSFAEAVSRGVPGGLASPTSPTGPRPSELFAGKGVQWNEIDLTSRDMAKANDAAGASVDLQKFLKERRQWIPTFKDSEAVEEADVKLPKSLEQFSFETPAEVSKSSAGLKNLKDLEDTHKRKAALLNPAPLASAPDGTIFEEAGPSTSIAPSVSGSVAANQTLPPAPKQPSRNQSFRTSSFAARSESTAQKAGNIARKPAPTLGVNGSNAAPSTAASRDVPQRRSSVRKEPQESAAETESQPADLAKPAEVSQPTNGKIDQIKEQAGTQTRPGTATGSVSGETSGFETPTGSQTHETERSAFAAQAPQDLSKTPVLSAQETTQDSSTTVTSPTSPPRPPKSLSRQSSTEPISHGLHKSSSTSFAPLEPVRTAANDVAEDVRAAPALQNLVPGTGAATRPGV